MKKIFINSIKDDLHTHREDYEIASAIADYFQFKLNDRSNMVNSHRFYTQREVIDASWYLKLGFHKQMYYRIHCLANPSYCFSGSGGECIRDYWGMEEDGYIENEVKRWKNTFVGSDRAYEGAVRRNYRNAFAQMNEKFRLLGRPIPKEYVAMNLYRETRCRNHFGKDVLENMFGNCYKYTPLMDQQLHRLKLEDGHCKDRNLLMALIFTRYTPELLKFKFDSGRKINTATIAYAEKLNRKFPYLSEKPEENNVEFMCKPAIIIPPEGNSRTTMSDTIAEVKRIFTSRHICGEFLMEYDTSIYKMIQQDVLTRSYQPLQGAHTAIAISKSIFDCALSQNLKSTSAGESLCRDVVSIEEEAEPLRKNALLDKYFTIRLDIRNDKSIKRYVFERLMSFVNYLRKALEKKK